MGILDSVNKVVQGVSNLTQGGLGGSLAQPNFQLFGTNIPGVPLVSFRNSFLKSMESWIGAIPLRTQFIIFFDSFPVGLNTKILQSLERTAGDKKGFDINRAKRLLTAYPLQGINGCMFAQGANIPDDISEPESASIEFNRGFIPGVIGGNRAAFSPLTLNFRETNSSFVDSVVRPWTILGAHAGMVARDKRNKPELDPKANVTIVQYSRSFQKLSQIPRKVWHFYNCVPTSVTSRNLSYDTEAMETFNTQWSYSHYSVQDNLYLPLPDLFDKLF